MVSQSDHFKNLLSSSTALNRSIRSADFQASGSEHSKELLSIDFCDSLPDGSRLSKGYKSKATGDLSLFVPDDL